MTLINYAGWHVVRLLGVIRLAAVRLALGVRLARWLLLGWLVVDKLA